MVFQKYRHRSVAKEEDRHVLSLEAPERRHPGNNDSDVMEEDKLLKEEKWYLLIHVETWANLFPSYPNWTTALAELSHRKLCRYEMLFILLPASLRDHGCSVTVLLCRCWVSYSDNVALWNGHQWVSFLTIGSWWLSINKSAKSFRMPC